MDALIGGVHVLLLPCRLAEFARHRLTWLGNCPRFCFVQSLCLIRSMMN